MSPLTLSSLRPVLFVAIGCALATVALFAPIDRFPGLLGQVMPTAGEVRCLEVRFSPPILQPDTLTYVALSARPWGETRPEISTRYRGVATDARLRLRDIQWWPVGTDSLDLWGPQGLQTRLPARGDTLVGRIARAGEHTLGEHFLGAARNEGIARGVSVPCEAVWAAGRVAPAT